MATEQRDSKIEDVNLELYTSINPSSTKHSREQPSIDTFGDNNHIPSSSTITNKGIISMNMNTTSTTTTTNTTASPDTPSVTNTSTIATYTNTTNELKEEEKQQINGHNTTNTMSDDDGHLNGAHHNSNQSSNLYGDLAPSAEFHDINEEEDDHAQMIGTRYSVSNHNNPYDGDIDDRLSFRIWCFCFFISSRRFPQCINDKFITYKNNKEIRSKDKRRHLGVCRYITQSIIIWIIISIYFGSCLFIIFTSIGCMQQNDNNSINSTNLDNLHQEMCIMRSPENKSCDIIPNETYQLWHMNIINSTNCDNIDNNKLFSISMDEYTTDKNKCPLLDDNYSINERKTCYIKSCDVNEVYFTDSFSTNEDSNVYQWFCRHNLSTSMLIIGIVGICFGQCLIMNIKQICAAMRS